MEKRKKKPAQGRNKKLVCINITLGAYEYVRKIGLNLSLFVENSISRLRLGLHNDTDVKGAQILVVSSKEEASGGI